MGRDRSGRLKRILLLSLALAMLLGACGRGSLTIRTVAGGGDTLDDGSLATDFSFRRARSIALDDEGNLYVADSVRNLVVKVDTAGIATIVAGLVRLARFSGDGGPGADAGLGWAAGVAVDGEGNLYIAGNRRVRKVDASGIITTVAGTGANGSSGDGGPAGSAQVFPAAVAVDRADNLYIADSRNHRIRKVDTSGTITTVAGNGDVGFSGDGGPAASAQLDSPEGVAVDRAGTLYLSDTRNHRVRKVDASGIITTVAGSGATGTFNGGFSGDGGPAVSAILNGPQGLAFDGSGNLYIADRNNHRIRRVDASGTITTVAGTGVDGRLPPGAQSIPFSDDDGGPATRARLMSPGDVAIDPAGNLYIADTIQSRVRVVSTVTAPLAISPMSTPWLRAVLGGLVGLAALLAATVGWSYRRKARTSDAPRTEPQPMASSDAPRALSDDIPPARGIGIVAVSFAIILSNFGGFVRLGAILVPLTAAMSILPLVGTLAAGGVAASASASATGAAFISRTVSATDAVRAGFSRVRTVAWVSLSTGMIVTLLSLTIVGIPFAIHLLVRWSMVIPVVALEGLESREARSRSAELVRGQWLRVMAIMVLMIVASGGLFYAAVWAGWMFLRTFGFPIGVLPLVVATPLLLAFASVGGVFTTLLYIDARARKEGLSETQLGAAVIPRA